MGRAPVLADIAVQQAKAGETAEALRTAQSVEDAGARIGAFVGIAGLLQN
jgi:hypothetical protein